MTAPSIKRDWRTSDTVSEARAALFRQLPQFWDSHGDSPVNDGYVHKKLDELLDAVFAFASEEVKK